MAARAAFADWRVLELSNGIAASYCGKMFVDAGAEVVKIESPQGDSMRRWSARPGGAAGALFGYLAAGKKSVNDDGETAALLAGADLVLTDLTDGWTVDAITAHTGAAAVVVAVTPFGMTGPYADDQVVANEFILQALCGSIASRGWPGDEPVQAGGRLGEWLAGTFAAAVAAATARHAARSGRGEIIDVSTYEAMVIAMGGLSTMSASVLGADSLLYQRSLELPSIVPTADGMVGFCTITAQQFQDFLVMIDRADLVDDAELASFAGRVERRDEFLGMVTRWTQSRTTQEIIDIAVAFRIPVAPIATPASLPTVDHFVQRGVFVESELGVLQPRVPYRSEAMITAPPGRPPRLGADNGCLHWPRRPLRSDGPGADADTLPLCDIRITDLTAFWAGPVATQLLGALGADVVKLEGVRRPDGMRFSAGRPPDWDQWWEWGPVFLCSNNNKRGISVELSTDTGRAIALELMAASDLVIENFSPRVMENFGLTWDAVAAANPRAVMVRMPAFGLDGPWRDRVGFAQTMEQATGMAWMTGHADGPPVIPRGICDPIAGLHAAFAAIAALAIRDRDGAGMHVESTMVEAALNVAAEMLVEHSRNGIELRREGNRGPGATPQGVYPCSGDDEWVALAAIDDAARASLARLLERPDLDPHEAAWRERADEIDKLISDWTARHPVNEAVTALRGAGVAAARVTAPAALLSDPQLLARGFWETVDHPVAGSFLCTGMPFAFVGKPRRWIQRVPPLYGQHTEEVLTGILGRSQQDLLDLRAAGITSVRPGGL